MADVADTLITSYVLDDRYSSGVNKASQATDRFGNAVKRTHSALGNGGKGGGMSGALAALKSSFIEVTAAITAVTAAVAAVTATGAGLVAFANEAVSKFAEYDTIERIFAGIYGSTKRAKEMMGYLNAEAQKGNFTFKDLADSAKLVVMNGLKFSDYQDAIQGIAIRAGGGGEGLKEATNLLTRLAGGGFGEGFQRLKELGFSPATLQRMGATFDKSGAFTGNIATALGIFKQIGKESAGIVHAMDGSAMAGLSNVKESLTRAMASAGEGIWGQLSKGVGSFANALNTAIDSGAIKETFAGIVNLFTADAGEIGLTKVIASVLAGVKTAAAFVKMVWDTVSSFLNQPIVQSILKFLGFATINSGLLGMSFSEDLGKIYESSYAQNLAMMERYAAKKKDPKEPDGANAIASPLQQIAANTAKTAEHTKATADMARHVLGGGDLGRMGLTPEELDGLVGRRTGASPKEITVKVVGTSFDAAIADLLRQYTKQLRAQGALR